MRALFLDSAQSSPRIEDLPIPIAPENGVVVEVKATGLCRSDWHAWAGHDDDIVWPHVPGHELAGVITSVGAQVKKWKVGDRVTTPFVCGCGHCDWCRNGDAQVCPHQQQPGFTHWGSFAEYVALYAADTNLVRIPDSVDFASAASLGCRFATSYRALVARAKVQRGEWVAVIGCGGVGLSAIMIAKALGAQVIAVDRNLEALQLAKTLGADQQVPSSDVPATIVELTGGGVHVAIDAVGSEQTCSDAILSLRRRGRHVQVGLLPPIDGHPRVPMARVIAWELDLFGSHGMASADYPGMMQLIESGQLRPQDLIEKTITLEEAGQLLPHFDQTSVAGITLINPALAP